MQIVGEEWARRFPGRFQTRPLLEGPSERQPCPVCGHPTGDCTPEEDLMAQEARKGARARRDTETSKGTPPAAAAESAGKDPDEKVEVSREPEDHGLPMGNPGGGEPVGVNDNGEVTGGGHEVSRIKSEGDPEPRDGSDSGSTPAPTGLDAEAAVASKGNKGVPDGFETVDGDAALLRCTKDLIIESELGPRKIRTIAYTEGRIYSRAEVEGRVAELDDYDTANLVAAD